MFSVAPVSTTVTSALTALPSLAQVSKAPPFPALIWVGYGSETGPWETLVGAAGILPGQGCENSSLPRMRVPFPRGLARALLSLSIQ
jgi:hypothetical protein